MTTLTNDQLNRLQNFGFTEQGAAIVDAIWFTPYAVNYQIGMVLICNPMGIWKAYVDKALALQSEAYSAKQIAHSGAKLPYAIAKTAFQTRNFDNLNYDVSEVQVRDDSL